MRRTILTAACLGVAIALSGCKSTDDAAAKTEPAMGMVNSTCPISGMALKDGAPTSEYAGHKVGFCCSNCVKPWTEKSATEKSKYVDDQLRAHR